MARRSREERITVDAPPLHELKRDQAIARAVVRRNMEEDKILRGRADQDGMWIPGPLHWAWNWTQTFDEHWLDKGLDGPYHAFPRLPYMPWLFNLMLTKKILFIPKSREMMVSWATVAFAVWFCQSFPRTRILIQSQKREKACELVKGTEPPGYARTLWERQPAWLRERHPLATRLKDQPADKLAWANGSAIQGVPSGADQVRSYHPTLLIMDEAHILMRPREALEPQSLCALASVLSVQPDRGGSQASALETEILETDSPAERVSPYSLGGT